MHRAITLFLVVVCVACAAAAQEPINPPKFVPVNIPGADTTTVFSINNAGVLVGAYISQIEKGFVAFGGKYVPIVIPGAKETVCYGLNSSNAIVGFSAQQVQGIFRGFLYQNGTFRDIGPNDSSQPSYAYGINDAGQIVGTYSMDFATFHGFVYDGTTYTTLDVPGAVSTIAMGINNQGQIVLRYQTSDGYFHAAIYNGSTYTTIDVPGAQNTSAVSINNLGDVAFTWSKPRHPTQRGAILHAGQYYDFTAPGADGTEAFGINDQDVIVGSFDVNNGVTQSGFKLIP